MSSMGSRVRPRWLLPAACLVLLGVELSGCGRSPEESYAQALQKARIAKDEMLATADGSPVPSNRRSRVLPLVYFPPDESYRVPAALRPDPGSQVVDMLTSTGQRRPMRVMGTLEFALKGQRLKLEAFAEEGSNGERLFVPFTDLTSGRETYGAGRYLDLDRTSTGIYVIDFNTAYNPYCAYNPTYDCPVPPPQNRLPIAIRAGEKIRGGH
jgi:uncharacterized protein (DUF1684 family)